jgi:hypothetical protein
LSTCCQYSWPWKGASGRVYEVGDQAGRDHENPPDVGSDAAQVPLPLPQVLQHEHAHEQQRGGPRRRRHGANQCRRPPPALSHLVDRRERQQEEQRHRVGRGEEERGREQQHVPHGPVHRRLVAQLLVEEAVQHDEQAEERDDTDQERGDRDIAGDDQVHRVDQ